MQRRTQVVILPVQLIITLNNSRESSFHYHERFRVYSQQSTSGERENVFRGMSAVPASTRLPDAPATDLNK